LKIIFMQLSNWTKEDCYNVKSFILMWGWRTLHLSNSVRKQEEECKWINFFNNWKSPSGREIL
jgi:hypothetical protein